MPETIVPEDASHYHLVGIIPALDAKQEHTFILPKIGFLRDVILTGLSDLRNLRLRIIINRFMYYTDINSDTLQYIELLNARNDGWRFKYNRLEHLRSIVRIPDLNIEMQVPQEVALWVVNLGDTKLKPIHVTERYSWLKHNVW